MSLLSPSKRVIDIAATIINGSSPVAAPVRASPSAKDVGRSSPAWESTGCGQGFGVSVDLSRFFADERARCLVWVSPGAGAAGSDRVRALAARLCARLPLPPPEQLALLAPLGLLHPDDPLALLRPYDTISVVPVERSLFLDQCAAEADCDSVISEENRLGEKEHIKRRLEKTLVHVSEPSAGAGGGGSAGDAAAAALHEMKQRALGLLAQYPPSPSLCPSPTPSLCPYPTPSPCPSPSPCHAPPPRARRRRVRRRRRPAPSGTDDTDAPMHKIPRADAAVRSNSDSDEAGSGSKVVRGAGRGGAGGDSGAVQGCERPAHAPRLVRAL